MKRITFAAALAIAFTGMAGDVQAQGGIIVEAGHYHSGHGCYSAWTDLLSVTRGHASNPGENVLVLGYAGCTLPAFAENTFDLSGYDLNDYSLLYVTEGYGYAVGGYQAAINTFIGNGGWFGLEAAYYNFDEYDSILGFDMASGMNGNYGCNDSPGITAAGTAFGLTQSPSVGCYSHGAMNNAVWEANGFNILMDFDASGFGGQVAATTPGGTVTPEPVTMTLLGTGLAGIAAARRRRQAAKQA